MPIERELGNALFDGNHPDIGDPDDLEGDLSKIERFVGTQTEEADRVARDLIHSATDAVRYPIPPIPGKPDAEKRDYMVDRVKTLIAQARGG